MTLTSHTLAITCRFTVNLRRRLMLTEIGSYMCICVSFLCRIVNKHNFTYSNLSVCVVNVIYQQALHQQSYSFVVNLKL